MIRSVAITAGLLVIFVIASLLIPPDPMTEGLSAAVFVAAAFGVWRWGAAATRVYADGSKGETSYGILGLVILLLTQAAQRVYSVTYLQLDRPEWMQVLHITPFLTYTTLIGLSLLSLATKFDGERPSRLPSVLGAFLAFFAVMVSGLGAVIISKIGAILTLLIHAIA